MARPSWPATPRLRPSSRRIARASRPLGRRAPVAGLVALLACLFAGSGAAAGSAPEAVPVLHHLPFPAGTTYKVWQGNDQGPSHDDAWNRYAFDFSPMPESRPVRATADGTVVHAKEDTEGPTGDWDDNKEIALLHADGTVGTHLHLEKDGVIVEVGGVVHAGEVIGRAGNPGNSGTRHVHFGLRRGKRLGPSVPCRFAEVPGDGVQETGDRLTSKNLPKRPPPAVERDLSLREKAARGRRVR